MERRRSRHSLTVADAAPGFNRLARQLRRVRQRGRHGGGRGPLQQRRALGGVGRDLERVLEVADRLLMGAEAGSPVRGGPQAHARLAGDRIGLGTFVGGVIGGQVVAGQGPGRLLRFDGLEVARRGQVTRAALAQGQRVVGDLADQRLDVAVLSTLRRPRVGVDLEQLAPDQAAQARLEVGLGPTGDGGERIGAEGEPQHGRVLHEATVLGVQGVEPRADERAKAGGDRQLVDRAGQLEGGPGRPDPFGAQERPDHLDGVQRHALGAVDDRVELRLGQLRQHGADQGAHLLVGEGRKRHGRRARP